jgi:alpha-beta hydrolase superfamily lysophospholipase
VIFLHGIRSHAGWYERTCTDLHSAGYEVTVLDRRGSGWNTAHRGDTPSAARLIADVLEYLRQQREQRCYLPVYLAGISWGGKLALAVAAHQPCWVSGVMLLCPGLVPKIQPPLSTRFRLILARLLNPTKRFPIPLNEPELFTNSTQWQDFIQSDQHGLVQTTARFLVESARLDFRLKRWVKRVRCPVLLCLAGQDRILNNAGTRRYMARLKNARSVTIQDWPTAHHTLEYEADALAPHLLRWMECQERQSIVSPVLRKGT